MTWTAYLDESGTHDSSPIMLMGGFLIRAQKLAAFNEKWHSLLKSSCVQYCHGKELKHRTGQFKGWSLEKRNAFVLEANRIIEKYSEFGFTAIIRKDDYALIYEAAPNPGKLRKDTKFGVLFRGCLWVVLAAVTENLKLANRSKVNFVLEDGAKNSGDAVRLFKLAKSNFLPGWSGLLGTLALSTKQSPGLQAADLLVYCTNIVERTEHGGTPSEIEKSSHIVVQGAPIPAFRYFRIPIRKESLEGLKQDFLLPREQWANMQSK